MESIIRTMKEYKSGRVIVIFGCGGGRSFERRYELGEMAGKYADYSIVTMDNPRNDDINDINKDIAKGIKDVGGKYTIIDDRKDAIEYAIKNANSNDIILLLGKGHEKYQEIKGIRYPFDEKKIINNFIKS
jgi:UDP-N-acetylmuramoyl-L-alanyl-D-glutamate--2,6-diaminopimelate ligase